MARHSPQQQKCRRQLRAGRAMHRQQQQPWISFPALLSGLLNSVSQGVVSSWKQLCTEDGALAAPRSITVLIEQRPLILHDVQLSVSSSSSVAPGVGLGKPVPAGGSATADAGQDPALDDVVDFSGFGPAFIGQVFTMCDTSRRGLIAVRSDPVKSAMPSFLPPPLLNWSARWIRKVLGHLLKDETEGPVFRFYFDKDEAATYVKRLNLNGSTVGSCPLDAAYRYFKGKPPMFRFVPDRQQVKAAKELLKKEQGKKAANSFKGVPVFTARNLTIAMSTPGGVRWFTPYFFDKKQVDNLVGHSVDHYYQMLIYARHLQRHSQVDVDFPGEVVDDDPDGLLDPSEVQEFMEEMGQGTGGLESVIVKAAEVYLQDLLDVVLLGNKWSRNLAGLQPSFPVVVDSFERRAAAAESEALLAANQQATTSGFEEDSRSDTSGGDGGGMSGKNLDGESDRRGWNSRDSIKSPFHSFGKNWGFNLDGVMKRKDQGNAADLDIGGTGNSEASTSSDRGAKGGAKEADSDVSSSDQSFQPKLTMMGIAMNGPVGDVDKAMAGAAKDIEDRIRKGEGSGREHRPLFIADLGGPLNFEPTSS